MTPLQNISDLRAAIEATPPRGHRRLVALSGGPGSGKTTLAAELAQAFGPARAAVLPMDGYHLDNRVLDARQLRARKGAPETFDVAGFAATLQRLTQPGEVIHAVFDRGQDCAIAGAGVIADDCETVIVEGNYLMLNAPGWDKLHKLWDMSVALRPSMEVLRDRLCDRWRGYGLSPAEITAKVEGNDMPNAELVAANSSPSDYILAAGD